MTKFPVAVEVRSQTGENFTIGPGEVHGIVHIEGFWDTERGCTRDEGFLRFTWAFGDEKGDQYVYLALFHPLRLWPRPGTIVRPSAGTFKKEITLKSVLDTRDCTPFRFANGEMHRSAHKYNDITIQLRCDEHALAVRMTYYAGELFSDPKEAYQSIDYELEYSELLWKRAATIADDHVMPEGESYVSIKHIGHISDPGVPEGSKISPIVVTPARG